MTVCLTKAYIFQAVWKWSIVEQAQQAIHEGEGTQVEASLSCAGLDLQDPGLVAAAVGAQIGVFLREKQEFVLWLGKPLVAGRTRGCFGVLTAGEVLELGWGLLYRIEIGERCKGDAGTTMTSIHWRTIRGIRKYGDCSCL